MADDTANPKPAKRRRVSAAGRQDGDYKVEVTGAKGGPIPEHRPFDGPAEPATKPTPAT